MKILIAGQARTGTTLLYESIRQALPSTARCLFEPQAYMPLPDDRDVLVKMLTDRLPNGQGHDIDSCQGFDRQACIVRDPRDRLVSLCLFLLHWHTDAYPLPGVNDPNLREVLGLLGQKVWAPASVQFRQLFAAVVALRFSLAPGAVANMLLMQQRTFLRYVQRHDSILVRYEDLLATGEVARIGRRLGLAHEAQRPAQIQRAHASIYRKGGWGEWRQWFTPEDVEYYRPLVAPVLDAYYPAATWTPRTDQYIDPRTSTRYVDKWLRVARWKERHALSAS